MWRILQQPEPDDYILATGEMHSVREFAELAFKQVGRTIEWRGTGVAEVGTCTKTGKDLIHIDPRYFRPTEVDELLGDSRKAHQKLGWHHTTTFPELVAEMVQSDLALAAGQSGQKPTDDR
jgi:GDPmannose 4,6-dehydratase